jgi:SPP1 family predicted phage head-tail adaptor
MRKYYEPNIEIQRRTLTQNAFGEFVEVWGLHLTIDGRIRPLNGNERLSADKTTLFATHRLYCDVADITEVDRVVYQGKIYNIKFVSNVMNFNRHLQIDLEMVE